MGFRFRKSFKIAPGVRLNMSKSGIGMSAGVRGARVGFNSRGSYTSVGIPGTGIYSTSYSKTGRKPRNSTTQVTSTNQSSGGGKLLLWIIAIIIGIALPPLGVIMVIGAVIYYYQRNKSPKYQAEQRIKKAKAFFQEQKYAEAEPLLIEAAQIYPENTETDFLLGGVYHNQGNYKEAAPYLERAHQQDPSHEGTLVSLANCYFNLGEFDKVIPLMQNFPGGWENNMKALQLLGLSFSNKKQHDLAIEVFKKAPLTKRNLDDGLLELHYNLGLIYEAAGQKANAQKHFKKVYAYNMNYKDVLSKVDGDVSKITTAEPRKIEGEIKGQIGYYGLEDWWLSEFSEEERNRIEEVFKPMGSDPGSKPLTEGDLSYSSQNAAGLLHALAGWFNKPGERELAKKIIAKATELAQAGSDVLDLHFSLQQRMEIYYRERETDPNALDEAIRACQDQIKIAPQAAKQFLKEYPNQPLPGHAGYTQLAIILKKQEKHQEVIELCEKAKEQGWAGDWDKRIADAQKKLT